jgi:hypothetical protein
MCGLPVTGDHGSLGSGLGSQDRRGARRDEDFRRSSSPSLQEAKQRTAPRTAQQQTLTPRKSSFPHSREDQLLIACARSTASSEKIQELIAYGLDWQQILDRAKDYGIAPLIYFHVSRLNSAIPSAIMHELRTCYRQSCAQAIHQTVKLEEVLLALAGKGISPIVMKGAALASLVYPGTGLRPMLDIDLLVKSSDLDAAASVFAGLGYAADESYQPAEWYRSQHHHLAPFVSRDGSVVVELHHQVASLRANVAIPIAEFWQRARSAQIASVPAQVLAPEDLLLSICTHVAISQRFEKALRDLTDIAGILSTYGDEIDWEQLVHNAAEYGAANCLYYCLWAAQSIMGAPVPAGPLENLKSRNKTKSNHKLSLHQDVGLKFLIPRAIFPASTRMRTWFINDLIGEILCPQVGMTKIVVARVREYWQSLISRN